METEPVQDIPTLNEPMKQLLMASASLAKHQALFMDKQELNYYKSFPEIADKQSRLATKLSTMINKLGTYIGVQPSKGLVKIDKTVEILDQYSDNIEIILKKAQEEEQKLKLKKRKEGTTKPEPPRPQKLYDLSHPQRTQQRKPLDFSKINTQVTITDSKPIGETKLTYIDTPEQFQNLINLLKDQKEVAVDLEHSDKSYYGLTCLMQLSTRQEDFIIDVLKIWKEMRKLNVIFNNPDILKVFHGSNMDIFWLHRDFDLRVCNLFDTYQAARQLSHRQLSYAYLLKHYTGVDTDKSYQMADWRTRPLTEQMLLYARMDTHYLLEIYDKLKSDIFKKSVETQLDFIQNLRNVYSNSDDVANIKYKEMGFRFSEHYLNVMERHRALQPYQKVQLMDRIFELRDELAKELDQNADEIFPRKYIFELADKKNFDYPVIASSFRKAPEALQKQTARIVRTLNEFVKAQDIKPKAVEEAAHQSNTMQIQRPQIKRTHQVKFDDDLEELYFDFDRLEVGFVEYTRKSLQVPQHPETIIFENPFDYLMGKYNIKKQQPQQHTEEPSQRIDKKSHNQNIVEQQPQEILYFNKDNKKRPRQEKPVEKFEDSAFKKKSKKQKREIKKEEIIKTSNHFSYLE